jgi:mannose-6-phosphate isomerase-like protein (cupin superfamily)
MFTRHKDTAPKRPREKLTSICLLAWGDVAGDNLAVTWVDVEPGGRQIPHNHPEVQIYVIVAGRGRMLVGGEQKEVSAGELVHVPSGLMHGIENIGERTLSYVSAANPAFDYTEAYDHGQLVSGAYAKNEKRV